MSNVRISGNLILPVLQEVTLYDSNSGPISTTTFTNSSMSVSITPKFSSSGILVIATSNGSLTGTVGSNAPGYLTIMRGSTNLFNLSTGALIFGGLMGDTWPGNFWPPWTMIAYDFPGTTAATTYSVAGRVDNSNVSVYAGFGARYMTAIEIAQ